MISEGDHNPATLDTKLSSSLLRKRQLGTYRSPKACIHILIQCNIHVHPHNTAVGE